MLHKLLKNKQSLGLSVVLICLFIGIRAFENTLFYDPFLNYFKSEYASLPFPEITTLKLFLNLLFRYSLNSAVSIALLWVIFRDIDILKFSGLLYFVFGIILFVSFFLVLHFLGDESKMMVFYIRRFIIQPIFILLFIPAFYYQNKNT